MATEYKIRDGFTFVSGDGSLLYGGAVIELEDDVAALHLHKLEVVEAEKPGKSSKVSKDK